MMITRRGCLASRRMAALIAAGPASPGARRSRWTAGSRQHFGRRMEQDRLQRSRAWRRNLVPRSAMSSCSRTLHPSRRPSANFASQGYNVILGHGFEFQDAALEVAPEYPDTVFSSFPRATYPRELSSPQHGYEPTFLPDGRDRGQDGGEGGSRRRDGDPADKGGLRGFHQRRAKRRAGLPRQRSLYRQLHRRDRDQGGKPQPDFRKGPTSCCRTASGATVGDSRHAAESGAGRQDVQHLHDYTSVAPKNILGLYVADYARGVIRIVGYIKNGKMPTTNSNSA